MGNLNYTTQQINALLASIGSINELTTENKESLVAAVNEIAASLGATENTVKGLTDNIGALSGLSTTEKNSLVGAINEVFQSASNGKALIASAITGKGIETAASDSYALMAQNISNITTGIERLVTNDESIIPSGLYATSDYYNTTYGVKIGYCPNGDILLSMKSGTTTAYENLNFTLASAPYGVTITSSSASWDTANPAGQLYVCVLSGITSKVKIAVAMSERNSTYDYTTCAVTVTEAA